MTRAWLVACLLFAAQPAFATAEVQDVTDGGAHAWLIEDHSLPIVTVKIGIEKSGSAYDPAGKEGLANFVSDMMDEGAGDMDSLAFHSALESKAIRFGAESGIDTFTLSVQTLADNKERAFSLFARALASPRFDSGAVERIRGGLLSELKELQEDPNYLASLNWKEGAFAGHPYGRPRHGTPQTLAAITPDDLHGFAKRMLCQKRNIGIVGDVTPQEVKRWLSALPPPCADQPSAGIAEVAVTEGGAAPVIVQLPVPQTVVVASLRGLKRDDPHYYALEILNHVLGGGTMVSRLGREIRDKRGLAYYAESDLQALDSCGYIAMNFATRNAEAFKALGIMRDTLKNLADKGITAGELADAKSYITGSFPLTIDNQATLTEYLLGMQHYHLGKDYLDKRNGFISQVTLKEVNNLARDLLSHPPLVVMAGAPAPAGEQSK